MLKIDVHLQERQFTCEQCHLDIILHFMGNIELQQQETDFDHFNYFVKKD